VTLDHLNALDPSSASREFLRCCASTRWAQRMTASRPFVNVDAMAVTADVIWAALDRADWLEAFAAHPRIGDARLNARLKPRAPTDLPEREASAERWAGQEQSSVAQAADDVRERLAAKNREYEARFGYIFIVCAAGRSADQMLTMLERRLTNDPEAELRTAAEEQRKITRLRLAKLLDLAAVS
jgi:2-oxo-4-hydroxy-4-carboxy-5-ureidoimidazoline decarboxylase